MRGMPRALPSLLACLLAVLFVGPTSAWAEEGAPAGEGRSDVAVALGQLASPVLTERREAVERLLTLMPGARPTLIAALRGATWSVQVQLLEVLARDGGDGSVDALLQHLVQADEAQGVRIRLTLVRDEKASARLLAAWRKDPEAFTQRGGPKGARRLQELADLLRRAEIEATFLARKSKSGSTGYYKGQYDALKGVDRKPGYRKLALQVVTGIAIDRAIPTPGLYRTGIYRFLRPHYVDEWEFQSMALNAVAELCTSEDKITIEMLEQRRIALLIKRERLKVAFLEARSFYRYASKQYQDAWFDWDDALGEYLDQVACLYIVSPDRYHRHVEEFIDVLRGHSPRPVRPWSYIAGLQIRCGWYRDAIDSYGIAMADGSRAYGYYNQACAYASWSRKAGLTKGQQERHLNAAMRTLQYAVEFGWSDIDWMNEDRDLDPLRAHRRGDYDALIKVIKEKYGFEDD